MSNQIQREINKRTVLDFYDTAFNLKDADSAMVYLTDSYIQHNPDFEDGKDGLYKAITGVLETYPNAHCEFKKVLADGDFVIVHVHLVREAGDRGTAIIDIFRLENGKLAEHWDVLQDIPSAFAHSNTMF